MDKISPNEVATDGLPENATGVYWTDTEWFECRKHLEDPTWKRAVAPTAVGDSDLRVGAVLYWDTFTCTECSRSRGRPKR